MAENLNELRARVGLRLGEEARERRIIHIGLWIAVFFLSLVVLVSAWQLLLVDTSRLATPLHLGGGAVVVLPMALVGLLTGFLTFQTFRTVLRSERDLGRVDRELLEAVDVAHKELAARGEFGVAAVVSRRYQRSRSSSYSSEEW